MTIRFTTACDIAKEERPFTNFKAHIDSTYSNNRACAQFIGVSTDVLKKKTSEKIKDYTYLSFMIDGNIDIETKDHELVYTRILHQGRFSMQMLKLC